MLVSISVALEDFSQNKCSLLNKVRKNICSLFEFSVTFHALEETWTQHRRYTTGKICLLATLWQQTRNSKPGFQTLEVMLKIAWCSGNGLCLHSSRLMSVKLPSVTKLEGYSAGYSQWGICNLFLMWNLLSADLLQRTYLMVSTKLPFTILQMLIHWLLQIFFIFFFKVPTCSYPTKATERSVTGFYSEAGELGSIFPLKYLRGKKSILTMATKFPLSHIQELISIFFVGI